MAVLLAADGGVERDAPVYAEGGVVEADASFRLGMVELIALVLEDGDIGEDGKAVSKALGDEELTVVALVELHGNVTAVGGRAGAQVDGHIEHGTTNATHELGLRERRALEMETADDAARAHALVVLHEVDVSDLCLEVALGEGLEEIAAGIGENTGLNDEQPLYIGFDDLHDV